MEHCSYSAFVSLIILWPRTSNGALGTGVARSRGHITCASEIGGSPLLAERLEAVRSVEPRFLICPSTDKNPAKR
jgi:hypothetical protein